MSKESIEGTPIDNLLYTTEDRRSYEKTKAELDVPDPSVERALGVLQGNPKAETQPKVEDESSAN